MQRRPAGASRALEGADSTLELETEGRVHTSAAGAKKRGDPRDG